MSDLTPTEDLVMEVLAARHRLGEHVWTFEARHKKTLKGLEAKGLVNLMGGITENTVRGSLTAEGRSLFLDPNYTPPASKNAVGSEAVRRVEQRAEVEGLRVAARNMPLAYDESFPWHGAAHWLTRRADALEDTYRRLNAGETPDEITRSLRAEADRFGS